jgi:hypothetical protein
MRHVLHLAIDRMSLEELRHLPIPVGVVIDLVR